MPNPFFSALLPSLSSSAAGAGVGALQGLTEGEDKRLARELQQSQIALHQAHAAHYGRQQKASQEAMAHIQAGLQADPNYLSTPAGRFYAFAAGKYDPLLQDARVGATQAQGRQREAYGAARLGEAAARINMLESSAALKEMQGDTQGAMQDLLQARTLREEARTETEEAMRDPRVAAELGLGEQRRGAADYSRARADRTRSLVPFEQAYQGARTDRERAATENQRQLADMHQAMTDLKKKALAPGSGPELKNKYQFANMLMERMQRDLEETGQVDPMEYTAWSETIRGRPPVVMGGINRDIPYDWQGSRVQPAVPGEPENPPFNLFGFQFGGSPAKPPVPSTGPLPFPKPPLRQMTPPAGALPGTVAPPTPPVGTMQGLEREGPVLPPGGVPRDYKAPKPPAPPVAPPPAAAPKAAPQAAPRPKANAKASPGTPARNLYDQQVLAARKLIKDKGLSYVRKLFQSGTFSPTERLAIEEAMLTEQSEP